MRSCISCLVPSLNLLKGQNLAGCLSGWLARQISYIRRGRGRGYGGGSRCLGGAAHESLACGGEGTDRVPGESECGFLAE